MCSAPWQDANARADVETKSASFTKLKVHRTSSNSSRRVQKIEGASSRAIYANL